MNAKQVALGAIADARGFRLTSWNVFLHCRFVIDFEPALPMAAFFQFEHSDPLAPNHVVEDDAWRASSLARASHHER